MANRVRNNGSTIQRRKANRDREGFSDCHVTP